MRLRSFFEWDSLWVQIFQVASLLKGPLVLLPVGILLSVEDQGFWFSFSSLGAAVILADLGFTTLLIQYVASEFSNSNNQSVGEVDGSAESYRFLQVALLFYAAVSILFFVVTVFVGDKWFFADSAWRYAWWVSCVGGLLYLLFTFMAAVMTGLGFVGAAYKGRALCSLLAAIFTCMFLLLGLSVWSLSLGLVISGALCVVIYYYKDRVFWDRCLSGLWRSRNSFRVLSPMLKVQMKFAVSWLFGFIIFQSYVPSVFKYVDAGSAGLLGFAIAILSALVNFSGSYITAKMPDISRLASQGKEQEALGLFSVSFYKRLVFQVLLMCTLILVVLLLSRYDIFSEKILPISHLVLLIFIYFCYGIISSWASYSRAHKEEVYVLHSAINAAGVVMAIGVGLVLAESIGVMLTVAAIFYAVVLMPWAYWIFISRRAVYLSS